MGAALGDQPLNSPQSDTRLASGWWRAKLTPRVVGAVGFAAGAGFVSMAVAGAFCDAGN
jgi:hypothetical protein